MKTKKLLLVVMDGVGVRHESFGNAVQLAYTPTLKTLAQKGFYCELKAHGPYVGLPSESDMGNSEVGHNALGAGRIFAQGSRLVSEALASGSLFKTQNWINLTQQVKQGNHTLHLLGLLSDGGVHSHEKHLYTLLHEAVQAGIKKIRLHCLLDGRDVAPQSAHTYLHRLETFIKQLPQNLSVHIASCGGRMKITMDRYNADWPMVEKGWRTHVAGEGPTYASAMEGVKAARRKDPQVIDQNIPPFVIANPETGKAEKMEEGDTVLLFNYRGDRSLEISRAFEEKSFSEFKREPNPNINFYGITEYDGDLKIPKKFLVSPPEIKDTLSEHLCSLGVRQFACSETQKYGHVTYFWNGNRSGYFDKKLETYVEIPSDNISFDEKPWMKAYEICEETIKQLKGGKFQFGRINFPNGDMVGHTGNLQASVTAVATVDLMLAKLWKACEETGTQLIVTADHGNCEEMFLGAETDKNPEAKTSHTLSPVPFYFYNPEKSTKNLTLKVPDPSLANMANTVLTGLGLETRDQYLESLF